MKKFYKPGKIFFYDLLRTTCEQPYITFSSLKAQKKIIINKLWKITYVKNNSKNIA